MGTFFTEVQIASPGGDPGDLEMLGAYTLEGFGLAIDPVQRRLIPAIVYGA